MLETVEVDITKTTAKLNEIALDSSAWEESSKLRLKNGKSTVKTTLQKFENTLKQTTSMIEKLTATNELLSDKKFPDKTLDKPMDAPDELFTIAPLSLL